jgi:beta-lactamase class A
METRRSILKALARTAAIAPLTTSTWATIQPPMIDPKTVGPKILTLFNSLPGDKALSILAPDVAGNPEFSVTLNADKQLFVGSAIKTFVLAEALRQADSAEVVATLTAKQLTLDASVWNLDSATFNPPNLIGMVSERTTLEAMIEHSDNTATDMLLKFVGPEKVRDLISTAQLKNTVIPDSLRGFFGYLLNAKNYETFSWADLCAAANSPLVNPPLNKTATLASSAADFVSYYSRALQGKFFKNDATLAEYRRILSTGDAIWLVPLPLGASAFCKGGSIDIPGHHAVCAPGGMLIGDRWVYFAFILNWSAPAETDPATVAAFAKAISQAMTMVKDHLSHEC